MQTMNTNRCRTSIVGAVDVYGISSSSTIQVGDAVMLNQRCRVLAVQREQANYRGNEGDFNRYPIYTRPIPKQSVTEVLDVHTVNEVPYISVGLITILGISTSATLQIGSNESIWLETRIKHFRHLLPRKKPPAGANEETGTSSEG